MWRAHFWHFYSRSEKDFATREEAERFLWEGEEQDWLSAECIIGPDGVEYPVTVPKKGES